MDNVKTGALIKQLRRDKGMTQKDLAGQLHITDRAVSKWERGISAPDISLLEPLSEILGVSVVELIRGELAESAAPEAESAARETLDYSRSELRRRTRTLRLRHLLIALGGVLLAALIALASLIIPGGNLFTAAFVRYALSAAVGGLFGGTLCVKRGGGRRKSRRHR